MNARLHTFTTHDINDFHARILVNDRWFEISELHTSCDPATGVFTHFTGTFVEDRGKTQKPKRKRRRKHWLEMKPCNPNVTAESLPVATHLELSPAEAVESTPSSKLFYWEMD